MQWRPARDWLDLDRPIERDGQLEHRHARHARRARGAAALDRARDGPGRHRPVPGRASTRSAPRSRTASTTTSSCPTARTSPTTTSSGSRRGCARSSRPTSRSCARRSSRDAGLARVRRPALQARHHREGRRVRGGGGHGRLRVPQPAPRRVGVRRPLPRAARAVDQAARCLQAHQGRRRLLARRRARPDAPAHLRHGLGVEGRARGAPPPPRGGRAARPPPARRRARPVLVPRGDRVRPPGVPPEGRAGPQADGGLLARAPRGGGLLVREHAPHHEGEPVRDVGPPRLVRGRHVPADDARRGRRRRHQVLPQADELPVPHPDLPQPAALVPRAAAAVLRVRDGVPLRALRRRARAHAGPRPHPGRRTHLLHQGGDGDRAAFAARVRPRPAARLRARRLLPRAVDQARGQGRRHRRRVGRGDRGAARGRARDGPRAGARPGRRRVLRPEDLRAGPRRDRPHVAGLDDPGRLPAAAAASSSSTSAPTTSATSRS